MKRLASIGIAFLVMGWVHTASGSDLRTEYHWSFEDTKEGALPEGWTVAENHGVGTPAKWQVIGMDEAPSGAQVLAITETKNPNPTYNLLLIPEPSRADLDITVRVKALSGEIDRGGGVMWRVRDKDNYYIARWNPLEDNFRVYFVKDGKRRQLASADVKLDPGAWHTIRVRMTGRRIEASVDGKGSLTVEDSTFPNAGTIGLWTKADAATAFDDLRVTAKAETP